MMAHEKRTMQHPLTAGTMSIPHSQAKPPALYFFRPPSEGLMYSSV